MKEITETNLISAFAGESQAHMRYLAFAEIAEVEGFPNVSRLFRAIADAERIHATNHFRALAHLDGGKVTIAGAVFGPGNTSKNLKLAIAGETFEIEEMYPAYLEVAKFQGEKSAERTFNAALEAEKIHAQLYKKAKEAVDAGKDVELGPIQICQVCGYTVEGEAPEKCPICGAPIDKFKTFK
jgi:rubrerythrin